jgi:hypothetical protein
MVVIKGYSEEATLPPLRDIAAIEAFSQQTASRPGRTSSGPARRN